MTKKSQAATDQTVEQPTVEQPTVEQPTVEQPTVEQPTVEQPTVEGAGDLSDENAAGAEEEPVRGRALVDLPAYDLKCGEFGSLPYKTARALYASGYFDPRAIEP